MIGNRSIVHSLLVAGEPSQGRRGDDIQLLWLGNKCLSNMCQITVLLKKV